MVLLGPAPGWVAVAIERLVRGQARSAHCWTLPPWVVMNRAIVLDVPPLSGAHASSRRLFRPAGVSLWHRLTLVEQFMLAGLLVFPIAAVAVSWWIGREVEAVVIRRTAETTALYVDSFVAPSLADGVPASGSLPPDRIGALDRLIAETPLGRGIVAIKVWDLNGRVLYSTDADMIGEAYPIDDGLAGARQGSVVSSLSTLDEEENEGERARWSRLMETYSPIRIMPGGEVVAVAEFYQTIDDLEAEILVAQQHAWLAIACFALITYLALAGIMKRGSDIIERQQKTLVQTVQEQRALLTEVDVLHGRVRRAATRVTALNEQSLRRVSAELHDGPAQDIALALLRLGIMTPVRATASGAERGPAGSHDLMTIETCLSRALHEVRDIASGLRLPELDALTLEETIDRVIAVHEERTSTRVERRYMSLAESVSLPIKITVYRVMQEALTNGFQHGGGCRQWVDVVCREERLEARICDDGPGLKAMDDGKDHLGLAVMRERVESLGGLFSIESAPGAGTTVSFILPLTALTEQEQV